MESVAFTGCRVSGFHPVSDWAPLDRTGLEQSTDTGDAFAGRSFLSCYFGAHDPGHLRDRSFARAGLK